MKTPKTKTFLRAALALATLALNLSVIQPAKADFFISTGALNNGRYGYTATLLPDGKVLVAGAMVAAIFPARSCMIRPPGRGR